MGFNRRKMGDQRRTAAEKEAATRRATDAQVLEDAARLIAAWNELRHRRARNSRVRGVDTGERVSSGAASVASRGERVSSIGHL